MELIAALLHSPEVLFLDEPTIGLDVVAQHNIQRFLREYQERRQITILLTSHYMKDVAALCRRVVVIANGQIMYDGSLSGIVDQFSGHKVVTLQISDEVDKDSLAQYGELIEFVAPRIKLKIPRVQVAEVLAKILDRFDIEDVSVEDPPLEDVIASLFQKVEEQQKAS
jgi:ABC-2 type transport system ATP-binding protein